MADEALAVEQAAVDQGLAAAERDLAGIKASLQAQVAAMLNVSPQVAERIVTESEKLYLNRMRERFSELRIAERLKRTNPFLATIRGLATVRQWAANQVGSALFASEEEAVGHLLEAIAKLCYPGGRAPTNPVDLDLECEEDGTVVGYQIKGSWDCMPMSSRKNLSATVKGLKEHFAADGKQFEGVFAPLYGKATTTRPKGQAYISMRSKEFWQRASGTNDPDFDLKVGQVCAVLCANFRREVESELVPALIDGLVKAATPVIGTPDGRIDQLKLFRRINK